jgi:hypothetical protein
MLKKQFDPEKVARSLRKKTVVQVRNRGLKKLVRRLSSIAR